MQRSLGKSKKIGGFKAQRGGTVLATWRVEAEWRAGKRGHSQKRQVPQGLLGVGRAWSPPEWERTKPLGIFKHRRTYSLLCMKRLLWLV